MTAAPRSARPVDGMSNDRIAPGAAERGRLGRAARFGKQCRPRLAVAAR